MESAAPRCTFILGWYDRDNGQTPGPYSRECALAADHPVHDVASSSSVYRPEMLATGSNYDSRGNAWDVNDHLDSHRHFFEDGKPAQDAAPKTGEPAPPTAAKEALAPNDAAEIAEWWMEKGRYLGGPPFDYGTTGAPRIVEEAFLAGRASR